MRQLEQVHVGGEIGHGVEHQHLVNTVVRHILLDGHIVVAQVKQMDLLELLGQEGGQGIGIGIPDDQQLPVRRVGVLDDAQRLVAPQEVGVFVLDLDRKSVV